MTFLTFPDLYFILTNDDLDLRDQAQVLVSGLNVILKLIYVTAVFNLKCVIYFYSVFLNLRNLWFLFVFLENVQTFRSCFIQEELIDEKLHMFHDVRSAW